MRLLVVSDPHYASAAETARSGWEQRAVRNPALRLLVGAYRHFVWLSDPTAHNHQLEAFIATAGEPDLIVANGDYSCDSAFVGLSDDAALESARHCWQRLETAYGERLLGILGDHELGKMSLFGGVGGPRLASWDRATQELGLNPMWVRDVPGYRMIGVTSTLIALPAFEPELLDTERARWLELRARHFEELRDAMVNTPGDRRIILFCHDPTALPFLANDPVVAGRLSQFACTIIGHLHSDLVLRTSNVLAGMPEIRFLGNTVRRHTLALRRARHWAPFRVTLCPSLAGIQLRKDGGYLEMYLDPDPEKGLTVTRHRLPWR